MADPYGTTATDDSRYMEQRWGDITRRVMHEINACQFGVVPLSEVPTLFAFGPISRELERAFIAGQTSERGVIAGMALRAENIRLTAALTDVRNLRDREYAVSVARMQQIVDANTALVEDRDRLRALLAGQAITDHAACCGSRCTVDGRRGACTCGIVPPRPTFPPNRVIKEGREAVSPPEEGK